MLVASGAEQWLWGDYVLSCFLKGKGGFLQSQELGKRFRGGESKR